MVEIKFKMAEGEPQNIGDEGSEPKVCTKKCIIITVSVVTLIAVLVGVIVAVVLLVPSKYSIYHIVYSKSFSGSSLNV